MMSGMSISLTQDRNAVDAQVHGKAQSSPYIPCVLLGVFRQDHHCLFVACPNFGKCRLEEPGLVQWGPLQCLAKDRSCPVGSLGAETISHTAKGD